ncbi:MAG TPA: hypothetical protein PKE65_02850 [Rhizobiaceae bacterium]|nr:hypothetical protein [Rhizobiaceae bacterium]
MKRFAACLVFCLAALPALADGAQEQAKPVAANPTQTRAERLDALFAELARAGSEREANAVSQRIWAEWNRSESDTIDLLMRWAGEAAARKDNAIALDFLDAATALAPTYAEAWNRRATLHYQMNNFAKSMQDIERTLALEPRHFGALSGLAGILTQTGHKEMALQAWERALAVYPMMRDAQKAVGELSEELAGDRS